jgi:hypothetical protein
VPSPRCGQPPIPAGAITLRDCIVDAEPTMMVRCVVGAMAKLLPRHRCRILPAIAIATPGVGRRSLSVRAEPSPRRTVGVASCWPPPRS